LVRLALVRDYRAEGWHSMDLCADELLAHLPDSVTAVEIAPSFHRLGSRLPLLGRAGFNFDRVLNRHLWLPRAVRRAARQADFVHVVDHSYAHVVNAVPAGRAGVYCHDLDAFRSLLDPANEPRPWWFRRLARRTLSGLQRAAVVFHNSAATARHLLDAALVPASRLVHAPLGVAEEFAPASKGMGELPFDPGHPFLLHIGNNIPRKRLDVLLHVFAVLTGERPGLRLVQVGGPWPPQLARLIESLGIGRSLTQVSGLSRAQLAELYRRAALVLVPSESEGFGLPVVEALACGAVVIASDLPTLREAGGNAVHYCPVGDIPAWVNAARNLLDSPAAAPSLPERLAHAGRFSWREHGRIIAETYLALARGENLPVGR
jgi:glycosyltransferase involved in cell wall biosynthesis